MRYETETRRVGEYLGPVDWSFDFNQHLSGTPEKHRQEYIDRLRQLAGGGRWQATTDGGWPRCGWGEVLQVGMYDGWPYWRPVPSVLIAGVFGGEWQSFGMITDIRPLSNSDQTIPSSEGGES